MNDNFNEAQPQVIKQSNERMGRFSFFTGPIAGKKYDRPMTTYDKYDAHAYITGEQAKERTAFLRSISDPDEAAQYKTMAFDFCTFGGTFSVRSNAGLIALSGLMCMDLDDIGGPETLKAVKRSLLADPFFETMLLFTSPGGCGIKWIISVANLCGLSYSMYYKAVQAYLESIGIDADNTSDVVRACFLPYDPDCYINMDPGQREYEAFNPKMWLGHTAKKGAMHKKGKMPKAKKAKMPLTEKAKAEKVKMPKVGMQKSAMTPAQEEAQTSGSLSFDFRNIEGRARVRRDYYETLTHEELIAKVETVVRQLEEIGIDHYPKRGQWISLGFQLVAGLGKEGLPYFVRLSKLYKGVHKEDPAFRYEEIASKGADSTSINYFLNDAEDQIYLYTGEDLTSVNSEVTSTSSGVQEADGAPFSEGEKEEITF